MHNLSKLRALNSQERAMLIGAFIWLGMMRLALWRLPFHRIVSRLGLTQGKTFALPQKMDVLEAGRIGWALKTMAPRTPWKSTCLIQALAGMVMLRRRKIAGVLYLGVAKNESPLEPLAAHAWLCSGNLFLTGESGCEQYKMVFTFVNQNEPNLH